MNAAQKLLIIKSLTKNRHLALKIFVLAELQWVYEKLIYFPDLIYMIEDYYVNVHFNELLYSCRLGHFHLFYFIYQNFIKSGKQKKICKFNTSNLKQAAENGHIEIVKFLYNIAKETDKLHEVFSEKFYIFRRASVNGCLDLVRFLYSITENPDHLFTDNFEAFNGAAEYGHLDVLKYLYSIAEKHNKVNLIFSGEFPVPAYGGSENPEVIQYLINLASEMGLLHKILDNKFKIFRRVCGTGYLNSAKILYQAAKKLNNPNAIFSNDFSAFRRAIKFNHAELVKYLYKISIKLDHSYAHLLKSMQQI